MLLTGNCLEVLKTMESNTVQCCVTSPPYYGLRSYLPDIVVPKKDTPQWVFDELNAKKIFPLDHI